MVTERKAQLICLNGSLSSNNVRRADSFIDETKSTTSPEASKIASIADSVASKVPTVASEVKSAVNAVATHLQAALERKVPRNVSLGTQQFCIGFTSDIKCKGLPLTLSDLLPAQVESLPDPVENVIRDQVSHLQPFVTRITSVAFIQMCFIIGLVLMLLFAGLFLTSLFSRLLCIVGILVQFRYQSRILVNIALGVICCFPLFMATTILYILRKKANSLPSWVEVKHGEVGELGFGALCCAIVLIFITAISPALMR